MVVWNVKKEREKKRKYREKKAIISSGWPIFLRFRLLLFIRTIYVNYFRGRNVWKFTDEWLENWRFLVFHRDRTRYVRTDTSRNRISEDGRCPWGKLASGICPEQAEEEPKTARKREAREQFDFLTAAPRARGLPAREWNRFKSSLLSLL